MVVYYMVVNIIETRTGHQQGHQQRPKFEKLNSIAPAGGGNGLDKFPINYESTRTGYGLNSIGNIISNFKDNNSSIRNGKNKNKSSDSVNEVFCDGLSLGAVVI